jgi:hypothetical protein
VFALSHPESTGSLPIRARSRYPDSADSEAFGGKLTWAAGERKAPRAGSGAAGCSAPEAALVTGRTAEGGLTHRELSEQFREDRSVLVSDHG